MVIVKVSSTVLTDVVVVIRALTIVISRAKFAVLIYNSPVTEFHTTYGYNAAVAAEYSTKDRLTVFQK
jgi:hypothetical protein